jgi:hypothetical protein
VTAASKGSRRRSPRGLLLYFGVGGSASAGLTLPWLAVIPGAFAAA